MKHHLKLAALISLLLSVGLGQDAVSPPKRGAYEPKPYPTHPPDQPWPGIETFPEAIQEYDALRVQYFAWRQRPRADADSMGRLPEVDIPDALFHPLAQAYLSSRLFYSTVRYDGEFNRYWDGSGGSGFLVAQIKKRLPEPWSLMTRLSGIVLVEVFRDTVLMFDEHHPVLGYPWGLVAYCRVLDDLLDTVEEDTIMVRHTTIWFTESMPLETHPRLLLTIEGASKMTVEGETTSIYWSRELLLDEKPKYMRVENEIIQDPHDVLGVNGKSYADYKQELLSFLNSYGIHR